MKQITGFCKYRKVMPQNIRVTSDASGADLTGISLFFNQASFYLEASDGVDVDGDGSTADTDYAAVYGRYHYNYDGVFSGELFQLYNFNFAGGWAAPTFSDMEALYTYIDASDTEAGGYRLLYPATSQAGEDKLIYLGEGTVADWTNVTGFSQMVNSSVNSDGELTGFVGGSSITGTWLINDSGSGATLAAMIQASSGYPYDSGFYDPFQMGYVPVRLMHAYLP